MRALNREAVDQIIARTAEGRTRFDIDKVGTVYPVVHPDHIIVHISGLPGSLRIDLPKELSR